MQARAMLTGRAPAQAGGASIRSSDGGAQLAGGAPCIGTTTTPPLPAAPRRPSSSVAGPSRRRPVATATSRSRAGQQQQQQRQQRQPALGRLGASSPTVAAPPSASASSAPAAAAGDGGGGDGGSGGSAPRPASADGEAGGAAAASRPAGPSSASRPRPRPVAPRAPPPHLPALAPSPEAAALARAISAAEDSGAGALVAALAGSALGVRVEPERYTRLARMFPDGLVDFWAVDLPERPRAREARESPVVPATPGRAALEYAALAAAARSLARCGARLDAPDLLDAIVDCRVGLAPAAAPPQEGDGNGWDVRRAAAALLLSGQALDPPARRRCSSPYTELSTGAIATAASGGGDPSGLALLADAAMARGVARTAPTHSDRPNRREFGAHDFGAAATVAPALGLAYQGRGCGELGAAVDAAVAATHPDPAGRDGAAIVAASVGWMAQRGQRRRREASAAAAAAAAASGGGGAAAAEADAGGGGEGGTGSESVDAEGPRELAEYLLASAPALRLGAEARQVLALVAGALGVAGDFGGGDEDGGGVGGVGVGGGVGDGVGDGVGGGDGDGAPHPQPRHPLGRGGPSLANVVPPGLDGAPGRWRLFWASPAWAALGASAVAVAGGPFPGTGTRFAGVAVLLAGAAAFGGGNAPAQAVSLAATMGGASAATASVVGAMAGALRGVGWLPRRWWDALEDGGPPPPPPPPGGAGGGGGGPGGGGLLDGGGGGGGVGRGAAVAVGCALGEAAAAAADGGGGGGGGEIA